MAAAAEPVTRHVIQRRDALHWPCSPLDKTLMTDNAFEKLLRRQTSTQAREGLHEARRELGLFDNDALWDLLKLVQDYIASLGPARRDTSAAVAPPPPRWVFQSWQLVCAGLAVQTAALSVAFFVGLNWGNALPPDTSWVRAMLAVPAGWMMFLLAMPVLMQAVVAGWETRKRDGFVGWLLLVSFGVAIAASAIALWWLL